MSLTTLYVHDLKGNLVPVEIDIEADSKEIGEKIKAVIAVEEEEESLTPSIFASHSLPNTLTSQPVGEASAERAGVAPTERDDTQIASISDKKKIQEQEERRSDVRRWLSVSDVGDAQPRQDTAGEQHALIKDGGQATKQDGQEQFSVAASPPDVPKEVAAGELSHHSDRTGSQTSLLTPGNTPPGTGEKEIRGVSDEDFFSSAYEMAQEAEEPTLRQFVSRSPPGQHPKRADSTSNKNIMSHRQKYAEWDAYSRTATVGSKKTLDSIYDGTSIKDLSLSETKGRERGATITDKIKSLMPRRSSSKLSNKKKDHSPTESPSEENLAESSHKRGISANSLMPPDIDSTSAYSTNTSTDPHGYLTTTDRRSSEVPDTSGVTSPLNRLRRSFSKGEKRKSFTENGSTPHIVDLMRKEGGPPVSTALVSPLHDHHNDFEPPAPAVGVDYDENDDEDEEDEEDGEVDTDNATGANKASHEDLSIHTISINPDLDGFREHALRLNPRTQSFLVDRLAQEQLRRYKELVGHKIRHAQDVFRNRCASGSRCLARGGQPTYFSARQNSKGEKSQIFFVRSHTDSAEVEANGAIVASFQHGIPEPPVSQLPAIFECSLCFKERKAVNKPSDWTKHVHEDLQPFTCTFKMCSTEKKSFKRKADWVRHENECHRHLEEWRCNYPECQHVCYRSDNFSQHLIREHKVPDWKNKTRGSTSSKLRAQAATQYGQEEELMARLHRICHSTSPAKPESEPCAFCGLISPSWKKHQVHLSKHMESIAMPILTLVEQNQVSQDTVISPIKREQGQSLARSNTISDVASTTEAHNLTPYSTSGSSFHQMSSASQSPIGIPLFPQAQPPFPAYPTNSGSFHPVPSASQSGLGAPLFARQQTSSPVGGGTFGTFGYGPAATDFVNMDDYNQRDRILQADASALYEDQSRMQFAAINSSTPSTYPPPNRRSPAHGQLQPPTSYPMPDQMSGHDFGSSPHSVRSYYQSTTPSPHQMRASPSHNQLEIPRSQAMGNQILAYSNADFASTLYTQEQGQFSSPVEAELYANTFHPSIEQSDLLQTSDTLDYNAMTATSMPMVNPMYDPQQYENYAGPGMAPHSQSTYQYQ